MTRGVWLSSPTQRILKQNPWDTDLLTSWSGRLSKPTWPPRLRVLIPSLCRGKHSCFYRYNQCTLFSGVSITEFFYIHFNLQPTALNDFNHELKRIILFQVKLILVQYICELSAQWSYSEQSGRLTTPTTDSGFPAFGGHWGGLLIRTFFLCARMDTYLWVKVPMFRANFKYIFAQCFLHPALYKTKGPFEGEFNLYGILAYMQGKWRRLGYYNLTP